MKKHLKRGTLHLLLADGLRDWGKRQLYDAWLHKDQSDRSYDDFELECMGLKGEKLKEEAASAVANNMSAIARLEALQNAAWNRVRGDDLDVVQYKHEQS